MFLARCFLSVLGGMLNNSVCTLKNPGYLTPEELFDKAYSVSVWGAGQGEADYSPESD